MSIGLDFAYRLIQAKHIDPRQIAYQDARRERAKLWSKSEAEDFCARKELEPGSYKPLVVSRWGQFV